MKLTKFLFNMPADQRKQLEAVAAEEGRSMSAIIRIALADYLASASPTPTPQAVRPSTCRDLGL